MQMYLGNVKSENKDDANNMSFTAVLLPYILTSLADTGLSGVRLVTGSPVITVGSVTEQAGLTHRSSPLSL